MSLLLKLVGAATNPAFVHDYRHAGGLVVTSWVPVTPLEVQGVSTSYVGLGSIGVNQWAYVVASASAAIDTPVSPGAGSLTIAGYAPTVLQAVPVTYGLFADYRAAGSVSITSWLNDGLGAPAGVVSPGAGALVITGHAPTVAQAVIPTAINSSYRAVGSLRTNDWSYVPVTTSGIVCEYRGYGSLQATSWFSDGVSVSLPVASISPDAGAIAITGYAPSVAQSVNQAVTPNAGSLAFTGYAPTVARTTLNIVQPIAGALTITGHAPTVVNSGVSIFNNGPGFDLHSRKHYIRRGGKILLFNSAHEADEWMHAEQAAEQAVQAAQKTSRLARKRIRERVYKVNAAPLPEVIDSQALGNLVSQFGMPFDVGSMAVNLDIEQLMQVQALMQRMEADRIDEEDVELLLMMI